MSRVEYKYKYGVSWRTCAPNRVLIHKYAVMYETYAEAEEKIAMLQAKKTKSIQLWEVKELELPEWNPQAT